MKTWLIASFFSLALSATAQHAAWGPPQFGIHLKPTDLVNFNPRFRAGVQVQAGPFAFILDAAHHLFLQKRWIRQHDERGYTYFNLRPELRYYLHRKTARRPPFYGRYLSLEAAVSETRLTLGPDTFQDSDQLRYTFDSATRIRRKTSFLLKTGFSYTWRKQLYVDIFWGLGASRRSFRYIEEVNKTRTFKPPTEAWGMSSDNRPEGTRWVLDMSLGLRLGIDLGR